MAPSSPPTATSQPSSRHEAILRIRKGKRKGRPAKQPPSSVTIYEPEPVLSSSTGIYGSASITEELRRRKLQLKEKRTAQDKFTDDDKILKEVLYAEQNKRGGYGYTAEETGEILLRMAEDQTKKGRLRLQRFNRLTYLSLLQHQHDLMQAEKSLDKSEPFTSDYTAILLSYYNLIKAMSDVASIKRPGLKETKAHGIEMARALHETQYWKSLDALNLFDLNDGSPQSPPDPIRHYLECKLPDRFLDQAGKDRREVEKQRCSGTGGAGTAKIVKAFESEPFHTSNVTDRLARIFIGIIGCIFLLAPMAVMTFLRGGNVKETSFYITVGSVSLFAMAIAAGTKATNQEMLAAMAAYTAVLVVFVGSAVTPAQGTVAAESL